MTIQPRAALYLRVSTARQAEQDVSIPDQRRQGEAYCRDKGFEVVDVFIEAGASATTDRRPEFQRMIEAGTAKPARFDVIVVHSFSRFFRDHFELEFHVRKLAKNGVKLVSITQEIGDDPVHVMMRQIMALFDEYQSKENAKHTLRAMKENARQGFWNGSQPPIGYRLVVAAQRGERIKKKLEIDPLHADTVRLIFRLAHEGVGDGPLGVKMIVNHLNENHIRTRSGGLWGVGAVHQILRRRTYFGIHEFNRLAKGKRPNDKTDIVTVEVPPLISEECFDAVQARLQARSPTRLNPAIAASPSLLTGVLHCGECGGSMTVMTGKGGRYRYYACANRRRKGATACSAGIIRTELLEDVVIQYIEKRLLDPVRLERILSGLLDQRQERSKERELRIAELNRKSAEAQQRLARLYAAIESGAADVDDPDLAKRIATLKATRDQAEVDAERAAALMDSSSAKTISPELLAEFTKRVKRRLRGSNGKYRRDHLHRFAQRVEIQKRQIRIGGSKESLFDAVFSLGNVQAKDLVPSAVLKWLPG
jgi:DNA invertase Pin-like site-specific DNA recombinase